MKLNEIAQLKEAEMMTDAVTISEWLDSMNIRNYKIQHDGTVDVVGDVHLDDKNLSYIPVQFGTVTGFFDIKQNDLVSLKGCPKSCLSFYFSGNRITKLDFLPEDIRGGIGFTRIDISSLEGIADKIKSLGGTVFCDLDKIKSHILGLVLIPGFRKVFIRIQDKDTNYVKAFEIVNKYAGRPEDVFECQAELIDNGFEEYAKL